MKRLLLLAFAAAAAAQDLQPKTTALNHARMVAFDFKPATGRAWHLSSFGDGTGTFFFAGSEDTAERELTLHAATVTRLAQGRDTVEAGRCETKEKHIAFTGTKTIKIGFDPPLAACSFNYSDDPHLNDAVAAFLAIERTLELGNELARLRRFDRLGLDAELDTLLEAVNAGSAIEVENIAPTLQAIVADDELMRRVRSKAQTALEADK